MELIRGWKPATEIERAFAGSMAAIVRHEVHTFHHIDYDPYNREKRKPQFKGK